MVPYRPRRTCDTLCAINPETLELSLSALEERPDSQKLSFCREEARTLVLTHAITAEVYSAILARLQRVKEELRAA